MQPPTAYLDPAALAPLRHLVFASRRAVTGHYAGQHASPQRGHSVEFRDYRAYTPGDPLGDVDWKVYGRTDRMFLKQFEHQSDMAVHLLLDASASMAYAGPEPVKRRRTPRRSPRKTPPPTVAGSKFDHACRLATAIAFLVIQQQDKVALGLAQGGLHTALPALGTYPHLHRLGHTLEETRPAGQARLPAALHAFAPRARLKGLLVVISDLADEDPDAVLAALDRFLHRGHEVIVFQTLHADELVLPNLGSVVLVDSETGRELTTDLDDLRENYARRIEAHLTRWRRVFGARGIDHRVVSTATPYPEVLRDYLFTRASLR
ncbi:MAG: DUF58 domain-containing protein [Planctomycetota bacterium]